MSLIDLLENKLKAREREREEAYRFKPRPYQSELIRTYEQGKKFFLICWARRLGKDLLAFGIACKECINKPNSVVFYVFPTMKQGKMMILDGYTNERKSIIETVVDKNALRLPYKSDKPYHSDNTLRFKNGSVIYFVGSQDVNTKVGGNLDLLVISEMALIPNKDLLTYLIPSVVNVGGKIILVSTPRFGSVFNEMLEDTGEEWEKSILKATDERATNEQGKPIYTDEKLEEARRLMSESKFRQEYLCDIDIANETAIYAYSLSQAEWIESLDTQGKRLYVSLDLGINDSTALSFVIDKCVIWHYANTDKPTIHYIQYIKEFARAKGITDIEIILPHDANNRHDAIDHLTSRRKAYSEHFQNVKVLSAYDVNKTIEITKHSIEQKKLKFLDCENVRELVRLMKKYEWATDKTTGENLRKPIHGRGLASSNSCDSIEYFCMRMYATDYDFNIANFETSNYLQSNDTWGSYL